MNVVGDASNPIALAPGIPGDRRQVSVNRLGGFLNNRRNTVLRAEDDVDDD